MSLDSRILGSVCDKTYLQLIRYFIKFCLESYQKELCQNDCQRFVVSQVKYSLFDLRIVFKFLRKVTESVTIISN